MFATIYPSMRDLIVEWNEWNGILDAFLNKLV